MARLTPVLQQRLQSAKPGDLVEVVLELRQTAAPESIPTERTERVAALDEHFTSSSEAVVRGIQAAGGSVLAKSWLSGTLKVRIPAEQVERLLGLDSIDVIDLPRTLTR
jgi:hypothetical protein